MTFYNKYFWVTFATLAFLYSCASTGNLSGGAKDIIPPKIVKDKSSTPMQLNTKSKKFSFLFDEYVEVKDVIKEVLVSPPLVYIPKVKSRGKLVTFEFNEKEILKENTTYIISFGESIRDFHEGNKLSNFKYVFSTGNQIDSLSVKGKIIDLETNKTVDGALVMLYEDLSDSIVIKKKPFYSAKTNKSGEYSLENIKKSKFRIIAIKDENSNNIYNESNEAIGFTDQLIEWDTNLVARQDLVISKAALTPKVLSKTTLKYGVSKIKLNTKLNLLPVYSINKTIAYHHMDMKEDSLLLYYSDENKIDSFEWMLPFDTIKIFVKEDLKLTSGKLKGTTLFPGFGQLPNDTLFIQFDGPLLSFDKTKIELKDSVSTKAIDVKISGYNKLAITSKLSSKKQYTLTLFPEAMVDVYNKKNDTILGFFNTFDASLLSKINLEVKGLDSTEMYLISLQRSGEEIKKESVIGKSSVNLKYQGLKADDYTVLILEDKNRNGVKDASSYWLQRQAEVVKTFKLDKLKEESLQDANVNFKSESK